MTRDQPDALAVTDEIINSAVCWVCGWQLWEHIARPDHRCAGMRS